MSIAFVVDDDNASEFRKASSGITAKTSGIRSNPIPAPGTYSLDKGEVVMYLALSCLRRGCAAELAGVSECTIRNLMNRYRTKAPKSHAKFPSVVARVIHKNT